MRKPGLFSACVAFIIGCASSGGCIQKTPADPTGQHLSDDNQAQEKQFKQVSNQQAVSGQFGVISRYPQSIVILKWEHFGMAGPARGSVVPNAEKLTNFPRLNRIPESTSVEWKDEVTGEVKIQTLSLTNVVPTGMEGRTFFELDSGGEWHVTFVPK